MASSSRAMARRVVGVARDGRCLFHCLRLAHQGEEPLKLHEAVERNVMGCPVDGAMHKCDTAAAIQDPERNHGKPGATQRDQEKIKSPRPDDSEEKTPKKRTDRERRVCAGARQKRETADGCNRG